MAQNLPLLPPEHYLSSECRALSIRLDEALNTRSLFEEPSVGYRSAFFSTNKSYARLTDNTSKSVDLTISADNEDLKNESFKTPNANYLARVKCFWKKLLPGWRKSLILNSVYIFIVLIINIIWLWVTVSRFESERGIYTLYKGSCSRASTINSGLHVLINILSTALLGSSNYATQCLTSPTRKEVDMAHSRGTWLYIGIPHLKNLRWISWRRKPLVMLLAISAWPLHVLWNSAVIKTIQSNQYGVLVVTQDFIASNKFDNNTGNLESLSAIPWDLYEYGSSSTSEMPLPFLNYAKSLYNKTKNGTMELLDNTQCMKTYSQPFLSDHRNLLLVTKTTQHLPYNQSIGNGSMLNYMDSQYWLSNFNAPGEWLPGHFICSGIDEDSGFQSDEGLPGCHLKIDLKYADNWTISDYPRDDTSTSGFYQIDHCLSEVVPEVCQVQLFLTFMVIVISCNMVKFLCVVSTIFTFQEPPIVVIGDALASFLEKMNYCPSLKFKKPLATYRPKRWIYAARSDIITTILLSSVALIIAGILLGMGIHSLKVDLTGETLGSLGFGQVSPNTLVRNFIPDTSQPLSYLIKMVLIVNSPQIVFTLLYLVYNRAYTKMLAIHEWMKFSVVRRSLRVSQPSGIQRSTYWLHIPYRYSIPLIITSSMMHWVISESFFLVRVAFYDENGKPLSQNGELESNDNTLTLPGYSLEAILTAIIMSGGMLLVLLLFSYREFPSDMPFIGNNSWAISTVCYRPENDKEAATKEVKWGAISHQEGEKAGHCCLTSFEVEKPIEGELYTRFALPGPII